MKCPIRKINQMISSSLNCYKLNSEINLSCKNVSILIILYVRQVHFEKNVYKQEKIERCFNFGHKDVMIGPLCPRGTTSCFWERCSFKDDNIRGGGGAAAGRGFTKGGLSQSPWTHDLDLSHLLSKRFYLLLFCVEFEKKKTFAQLHVRSITWAVI